jgi:hypothetical protein
MNDSFLYHYRGYYYSEDYRGNALIFWSPETNDWVGEWSEDEFQMAIDDKVAQMKYEKCLESLSFQIEVEGESYIAALRNYELSKGYSLITVLHEAGKTIKVFQNDLKCRIKYTDISSEL